MVQNTKPTELQTGAFTRVSAYMDELRERNSRTSYVHEKIQAALGDYFINNDPELETIHPEQMIGDLLTDVCIGRRAEDEVIEVETKVTRYLHKKVPQSDCGHDRSRTARAHEHSARPEATMNRLRGKFLRVPSDYKFSICIPYGNESMLAAFLEELELNGPPISRVYLYSEKENMIVGCGVMKK